MFEWYLQLLTFVNYSATWCVNKPEKVNDLKLYFVWRFLLQSFWWCVPQLQCRRGQIVIPTWTFWAGNCRYVGEELCKKGSCAVDSHCTDSLSIKAITHVMGCFCFYRNLRSCIFIVFVCYSCFKEELYLKTKFTHCSTTCERRLLRNYLQQDQVRRELTLIALWFSELPFHMDQVTQLMFSKWFATYLERFCQVSRVTCTARSVKFDCQQFW